MKMKLCTPIATLLLCLATLRLAGQCEEFYPLLTLGTEHQRNLRFPESYDAYKRAELACPGREHIVYERLKSLRMMCDSVCNARSLSVHELRRAGEQLMHLEDSLKSVVWRVDSLVVSIKALREEAGSMYRYWKSLYDDTVDFLNVKDSYSLARKMVGKRYVYFYRNDDGGGEPVKHLGEWDFATEFADGRAEVKLGDSTWILRVDGSKALSPPKKPKFAESYNCENRGLQDLPEEILIMKRLTQIYAGRNRISEVSGKIKRLQNLLSVDLKCNRIRRIQPLTRLRMLESLNLRDNRIHALPENVERWSALSELNLAGNRIEDLPRSIGSLQSLKKLDLSRNRLDTLCKEIGDLIHLEELDLGSNELKTIPQWITNLKHLRILRLTANNISAKEFQHILQILPELPNLRLLYIGANPCTAQPELRIAVMESIHAILPNCLVWFN